MNPGAVITVAAFGLYGAFVLYGLSHDVRRWVEERLWRRDEKRAEALLRAYGGVLSHPAAFSEAELEEIERLRSAAAWCEAMALQLDEIRNLPEQAGWLL